MRKKVIVDPETLASMHRHALADFPNECVGFFFGETIEDAKKVKEYTPLENSKEGDQRRRFEVHPKDYMAAERYAIESKQELLGVYHSHPEHPAEPSVHDLAQAVPFFSYIIASVSGTSVQNTRSWQLNDQNEFEEEIITNE
ncbi:M67 family metallopeptidase [Reichenbachiella agarivorans]|uniref:M67 family metallopeptidase n=1 Tax=Reichenbachiella agarivorans TaxID=2979464 RepID=A0ABY6CP37_9BACT|nr:M67 family metallopeptidase [Reichenbachiella agarivorans]UXP31223.1 M67 family metallopeptidase [Reichenbachiella agarivorans]